MKSQEIRTVIITFIKYVYNAIMNKRRKAIKLYYTTLIKLTAEEVKDGLMVNHKSYVSSNTHIGSNVHFNGMNISGGGKVTIGDNFHSGPSCRIIAQNHNFDRGDAIPYGNTYINKDVHIGDNVWFGAEVTVIPGVKVEEGAIIQAGATVVSDVPKGAIVGGNPAEIIRYRDMEHYNKLKSEGSFH
ncbi:acyltransferase [Halobellus rufus]|uniref:acyltransferase n=1 Tax=Halobellus rufus TaxID=1448860 RepID=UPI0018CF429A|nr:acyltransferase [Halobellus rufus]